MEIEIGEAASQLNSRDLIDHAKAADSEIYHKVNHKSMRSPKIYSGV